MFYREHCKRCKEKLGDEFGYVHKWMDEYALQYPVKLFDDYHRMFRHHQEGIDEVRKMLGNNAAEAAKLHIIDDIGYVLRKKDYHGKI